MILGAQLYTIREFTKTPECFDESMSKIAQMGYNFVQISAIGQTVTPEVVSEVCNKYNLGAVITHTNPGRILNETQAVIDEHKVIGAGFIGIGSMPNEYPRSLDGYMQFVKDYTPAAKMIKAQGLTLMYHNHAFEFEKYNGRTGMHIIKDEMPEVGFTLDTYWIQAGGCDPAQFIIDFKDRCKVVHFKDMIITDNKQCMAEVMEGNLNWDAIFKACVIANVEYAMVEQDDCYGKDPFDCLALSLNNLKKAGL